MYLDNPICTYKRSPKDNRLHSYWKLIFKLVYVFHFYDLDLCILINQVNRWQVSTNTAIQYIIEKS